jgi:hypothetical protein
MACACSPKAAPQGAVLIQTAESTAPVKQAVSGSALDASKADCFFATIQPASVTEALVHTSGSGAAAEPFTLKTDASVRVSWDQNSSSNFELTIVNLDPAMSNDPARELMIESFIGPSAGCSDIKLAKGEYQIATNENDGSWDVLVQVISYTK